MPPSKPRDSREFVRVAVTLPDDPKLLDTTDVPRCGWLYVAGLLWARKQRTDGVLRPEVVVRDAAVPRRLVAELVRVGMWHEPGHDCDRCEQPPARHVVVHDYLEHQQSKDESDAARAKARAAAEARWSARDVTAKAQQKHANRNASSNAPSIAPSNAEVEKRERREKTYLLTLISRLAAGDARGSEPPPAEVIDAWQNLAGPTVDLDAEAAAYLMRFGDRPADDERGAWLGWLTKARQRTDAPTPTTAPATPIPRPSGSPTPIPSAPRCPIHPEHTTGSKACPRCTAEAAPARTDQLRAAVRRGPVEEAS